MTSHSKVHSQLKVPFAWENQPGISKAMTAHKECPTDVGRHIVKLPPPPCLPDYPKVVGHDHLQNIPLPPCPFQPPSRSSSRKGLRQHEDPFLAAYKECTKSSDEPAGKLFKNSSKKDGGSRLRRKGSVFSCKQACGVREDSLVRVSHLSPTVSRERSFLQNERRVSDASKGT